MNEQQSLFSKKTIINLLFLGILVLGLPIGTQLIQSQKILKSFAAAESIKFITDGKNVVDRAGKQVAISPTVTLEITSKDGLPNSQANTGVQLAKINYSPVTKAYAYEACGADPGVDPDDPEDDECYCDKQVVAWCNCEGNCTQSQPAQPKSDGTPSYSSPSYGSPYAEPPKQQPQVEPGKPKEPGEPAEPPSSCDANKLEYLNYSSCDTQGENARECAVYKNECGSFPIFKDCNPARPGVCGKPEVNASLPAASQGSTKADKDAECRDKFIQENGGPIYYCDNANFDPPKCIEKTGGSLDGQNCADVFSEVDSKGYCPGTPCQSGPAGGKPQNIKNPPPPPHLLQQSGGECTNGVKAGETACDKQGDSKQRKCQPGSTPDNPIWADEACTSGGTCQGRACTGGTQKVASPSPSPAPASEKCYVCDNNKWRLNGDTGSCPANITRTCQAGKDVNQVCKSTTVKVDDNCISTKPYTVSFRVAETPTGFAESPENAYESEPMRRTWTFKDPKPGKKFIYVEFTLSDGKKVRANPVSIDLIAEPPQITSLTCNLDAAGNSIAMTFQGKNFGVEEGKLATSGSLKVLSWKDDTVTGLLENVIARSKDDLYRVTLTRADGEKIQETCGVGVTLLSLGARLFCRAPSQHSQDNVDVEILENTPGSKKVKDKVKIDKDGVVQGIKTKLEDGKVYKVALKAPKSLRRTVIFTAANGTTSVPETILPVGDIYPRDGGDGKINSLDAAELRRQWGKVGTTSKNCDFNQDDVCNSFEWACMRYDFNKEDDIEPTVDVQPSSPSAQLR